MKVEIVFEFLDVVVDGKIEGVDRGTASRA